MPSTAWPATTASKALPPACRMRSAARVASGFIDATACDASANNGTHGIGSDFVRRVLCPDVGGADDPEQQQPAHQRVSFPHRPSCLRRTQRPRRSSRSSWTPALGRRLCQHIIRRQGQEILQFFRGRDPFEQGPRLRRKSGGFLGNGLFDERSGHRPAVFEGRAYGAAIARSASREISAVAASSIRL